MEQDIQDPDKQEHKEQVPLPVETEAGGEGSVADPVIEGGEAGVEAATGGDIESLPDVGEGMPTGLNSEEIVEAVLFSSDSPMPVGKIATVIGALSSREIRAVIEKLNEKYGQWNCAFRIEEIAGGFQMMTRPEFANYLHQLYNVRSEGKLSPAALETLAIIAYKQPVLRAEIEAIRGVACGEMIRTLMEKDLIKIVGRAEELGRPMLYGTTKKFMQVFGLASLEDLPKVPELLPPNRAVSEPPKESGLAPKEETKAEEVKMPPVQEKAQEAAPEMPVSSEEAEDNE
jgi:segregation and condensation protein B